MTAIAAQYDFTGKVVLITGGSRGLGHAMALGFGECGAKLAIASRKIDSCEATVAELRALGSDGSAHAAHVGKWADCDRLVEEVYARWGRIDVLVNNAGLSPVVPSSLETSEDLFDKVIGVNLKGPFRLTSLIGHADGRGRRRRGHQYLLHLVDSSGARYRALLRGQGRPEHIDGRIRAGIRAESARQCDHGGPLSHRHQ